MNAISAETAHRMRNPLSALKGHAQLLCRSLSAGADRDRAEWIVRESVRLEKAIVEAEAMWGRRRSHPHAVDPRKVAASWVGTVDNAQIRLDVTRAPARWTVDRERLEVILDLLLRAILSKRSVEQPIDLVVKRDRRRLVVLFGALDARIGSGPRRLIRPRGGPGHSGIYAIADHLARRHGGQFAMCETREGGLLFRLTLGGL